MKKEDLHKRLTEINENLDQSKKQIEQLMANHNVLIGSKEEIVRWLHIYEKPNVEVEL